MSSPRWTYLCLLVWIPAWLALNIAQLAYSSLLFASVSMLPLLFPLPGILKDKSRAEIWGAYATIPAFLIGVMESWSNPPQRLGALVQVALVALYWLLVVLKARHQQPRG